MNVNDYNALGCTPLIMASYHGEYKMVQDLLDKEANIEVLDSKKQNALYYSIIKNHFKISDYLISKGAHIDS